MHAMNRRRQILHILAYTTLSGPSSALSGSFSCKLLTSVSAASVDVCFRSLSWSHLAASDSPIDAGTMTRIEIMPLRK